MMKVLRQRCDGYGPHQRAVVRVRMSFAPDRRSAVPSAGSRLVEAAFAAVAVLVPRRVHHGLLAGVGARQLRGFHDQ